MDAPATPVLEIDDLSVEYRHEGGSVEAVRRFSLALRPGESFGLVGESGCGKSSVAMAVMGYLGAAGRVGSGDIRLGGQSLVGLSEAGLRKARRNRVAMVYQEPMSALNPSLTIRRQLREALGAAGGLTRPDIEDRIRGVLDDVRIRNPEDVVRRYPHQLSGGQQQRIVIAMALLANPALIILDEPTTALDVTVQAAIADLLADIQQRYATTLLYISHNLALLSKVCRRVGVMYLGELVETADTREIFEHPRHPYTHGLLACIPRVDRAAARESLRGIPGNATLPPGFAGGCRFGPRCESFQTGLCDGGDIPMLPVGDHGRHDVRCVRWAEIAPPEKSAAPRPAASGREDRVPVLEVRNLKKQFGDGAATGPVGRWFGSGHAAVKAVNDVSLDVARTETVAVVGESGCGKSTLAEMVVGLIDPSAGSIRILGMELGGVPVQRRNAETISALQMVFQNPDATLNPTHSIGRALARAVAKLGRDTPKAQFGQRARELLRLVRLSDDMAERYPAQLSGGQKQRVAIARAFAGTPHLVVADEPLSALDVSVQAAILQLLLEIQEREGTALLFISHDLGIVRSIADRVVVMYRGMVMEAGHVEDIFSPPYHPYTEALLSSIPAIGRSEERTRIDLVDEAPDSDGGETGCPFAGRCHRKIGSLCDTVPPPRRQAGSRHGIHCHIPVEDLRRLAFGTAI
ncbi:MAG: dipeptide ABC transporter ATP-binding protein [Dongiaceae bacterium]